METEQFNIRVPKDLLRDLDVISSLLKVNKSEWVKTKLAEEVHEEKNRLLLELSTLYSNSLIGKKEVEALVGRELAGEMEFIKEKSNESVKKGADYGKELKRRIRV